MDFNALESDSKSRASAASVGPTGSQATPPANTPKPWYRLSLRTAVIILLPLLSILGAFGTWTLGGSNGTFKSMIALVAQDEPKFPGTDAALLKKYTGIRAVDGQLAVLVTFFGPVVDGKSDNLTLFSVFGFGQFGAVWTLMMLESFRVGNVGKFVSWIGTVGFILQNITYTITVPLWLMLHLLTSPVSSPFTGTHSNSAILVSSLDLKILPISVALGYIIPSILMALPSPDSVSPSMHQIYMALWQAFPIWTVVIHQSLKKVCQMIAINPATEESDKPPLSLGTAYLSNVKYVYRLVIGWCIVTHLPVALVTLLPSSAFQDSVPTLARLAKNTFADVFVPYTPFLSYQVSSLAEGVITFLQWDMYVGSVACILWAVLLYRNATTEKTIVDPNMSLPKYTELQNSIAYRMIFWKIVMWCAISGPVGAVAILLWERDEIVRQKIKQGI